MDKRTVSFPLGGVALIESVEIQYQRPANCSMAWRVALIESVEKDFGVFSTIFEGIGGRARDFVPLVKFHVNNRLTHSVS